MNIIDRIIAPTPKFFIALRTIGLMMATVGGTLLASPVALPVVVGTIADYLTVAGAVISAVSQITTADAVKKKVKLRNDGS